MPQTGMKLANETNHPEEKALDLLYADRHVFVDEAGKEPDRQGYHSPTSRYKAL